MREALRNGANVNTRTSLYRLYRTPFMKACAHGGLEAVRFLSTVSGIDLNAVDNRGRSAFHYACMNGNLEIIRFLVTLTGVNLLRADNDGWTGLHQAMRHLPIVQFLLSSDLGFDVKVQSRIGWSALFAACCGGSLDVVEYLLTTHNANIHAVDNHGKSCLHVATEWSRAEVVRYLLANYPDADLVAKTDCGGDTALHYSTRGVGRADLNLQIAQLLFENGAHVNAINNRDRSP